MDMKGKLALVTGATDGVGRIVAERLGAEGMRVIVHGRDPERGAEAADAVTSAGGQGSFIAADLSALEGVRELADAVKSDHGALDLLINNAGIGFGAPGAPREVNDRGVEMRFQVDYLAPVFLTHLLLPELKEAAPSRVVMVASAGQAPLDWSDPMSAQDYDGETAYRRAKLALIMASFDLAEELKDAGVTVTALHPDTLMDTTMVREMGIAASGSKEMGARAILNLAVGEATEGVTGEYFDRLDRARARPEAYDPERRSKLRDLTRELLDVELKAA